VIVDGEDIRGDLHAAIEKGVGTFLKRQPEKYRADPAAVILVAAGAKRALEDEVLKGLRDAGVKRIALKLER
jgi:pyruvate/2-oxoacid:ferredoxin oxidoreductase alpha subunit